MPRMSLPPTPAASTEIRGKDSSPISSTEKSFNLPPPAIESQRIHGASPVIRQPQASASADFFLPPPPTRARTIIQMKPKPQSTGIPARGLTQQGHKGSSKKATSRSTATVAPTKRQPSSTSVAGKKSARKTAHSVIERRRRSKINEEFGTLKAMIPACKEQDMHKLAILQASIDYLRYLENCITDLRAANTSLSTPLVPTEASLPLPGSAISNHKIDDDEHGLGNDIRMGNSEPTATSPKIQPLIGQNITAYSSPQSVTESPAIDAQTYYQASSHAVSGFTLQSPAFGPHKQQGSQCHFYPSASTSPTIMPSEEQDQEATAVLLMLNKDRRHPKGGCGMSVRDLLSA